MGSSSSMSSPAEAPAAAAAPAAPEAAEAAGPGASVAVLGLSGETITTKSVGPKVSIRELKAGFPPCVLTWEGRTLKNGETVQALGWSGEVTVHMVVKSPDLHTSAELLRKITSSRTQADFDADQLMILCYYAKEQMLKEPTLLELSPPLVIVAHLTGRLDQLNKIFDSCGDVPETKYLFLGNLVDRGQQGLDVLVLLLSLKLRHSSRLHLLRGRHECGSISRIYGFYDECKKRSDVKVWRAFINFFDAMPICALINHRIFCVASGLSPELQDLEQIRQLRRPMDVPDMGLLTDLLWSDPEKEVTGWNDQDKGVSYTFGADVVQKFLKDHDLDLIVRGNQVVEEGYEYFAERLVSLFSVADFCGEFDNIGAVMLVDENLEHSFKSWKRAA
ncbi:unnamed protein product [Effrenium voratum]|nr:unnamed protein product [Effrenium voratum]